MKSSTDTHSADMAWLEVIRRKVTNIRYGTVQVIIHDGKVTQIETTEKTRFNCTPPASLVTPK